MAKTEAVKKTPSKKSTTRKKSAKSGSTRTVKKTRRIVKKSTPKKNVFRNVGINVIPPLGSCKDRDCPFHGSLSIRGQILEAVVAKVKMTNSAVVVRERLHYLPTYERYEKRRSRHTVHNPVCLGVKTGDLVKIAECRPLSKTKSFVIIERRDPI